jgi:uncharacterized protein DUF4268
MAIYQITADSIERIEETTFQAAGLRERADLQRLLRTQIDVIAPDTMVLAEEFGEWEDSRRRIDLLALDKDANLVVVELKRTEDGGHMELQAVRYAAMVSTMTFEQAVEAHDRFLKQLGQEEGAEQAILEFLDWEEADEEAFGQDVRIVLVSAEFGKELTTAVMWLNERDLDVRCIRIKPYQGEDRVFLDVQQIIPLPEALDYQVRVREKGQKGRETKKYSAERYQIRQRFWTGLLDRAREKTKLFSSVSPSAHGAIGTGAGVRGLLYLFSVTKHEATAELYIDRGKGCDAENTEIMEALKQRRQEVDAKFDAPLAWRDLENRRACRIAKRVEVGGYRDEEERWPEIHDAMIDAMTRLEAALAPHISRLSAGAATQAAENGGEVDGVRP